MKASHASIVALAFGLVAGCLTPSPTTTSSTPSVDATSPTPGIPPGGGSIIQPTRDENESQGFRLVGNQSVSGIHPPANATFSFVGTNTGAAAEALFDPCGEGNPRVWIEDANGTRLQLAPPMMRCMAAAGFGPAETNASFYRNFTWNGTAYHGEKPYTAAPGLYRVVGEFEGRRSGSIIDVRVSLPFSILASAGSARDGRRRVPKWKYTPRANDTVMALGLALSVALNLATTALLAFTGILVLDRPALSRESRGALRMFSVWWFSAASVVLLSGSHTILALLGVTSTEVHSAVTYALAVPLAVGLWGLVYFLVYVYTGRASARWPLTLAYVLFLAFELYYFAAFGQRSIVETPWQIQFASATRPPQWMSLTFGFLLAVPILFVVVGFAGLFRTAREPSTRRRLSLVSAAFGLLFGAILLGYVLGLDRESWFPLVYEVPALIAGVLVVMAYRHRATDDSGQGSGAR